MAACRLANDTHRSKRSSRVRGLENDWVALHQVSQPSDCNSGWLRQHRKFNHMICFCLTTDHSRSYDI